MIVALSDRQLFVAWRFLSIGANWGGTEDIVVAQGEIWEVCGLGTDRYKPLTTIADGIETPTAFDMTTLSDKPTFRELSDNAITVLRQIFGSRGQDKIQGLLSYAALVAIREANNKASSVA